MVAVTDENVRDIIDAAGYGIVYWAQSASAGERDNAPNNAEMIFVEEETGKVIALTIADIRAAYYKMLKVDQKYVGKMIHDYILDSYRNGTKEDGIDAGFIDSDAADCIVQVAAFGEVVYG